MPRFSRATAAAYLLEQHFGQDGRNAVANERRPAGDALEEHASEREDVRARIDAPIAARLLRRHVRRRSDRDAHSRQGRLDLDARDAEVEQLHKGRNAAHEPQVCRLDVAVDYSARVRNAERFRHAPRERYAVRERQPLARQPLVEIFALEPLHRNPRHAVRHVPHDSRMLDLREQHRLALEASGRLGAQPVKYFQRDALARLSVPRPIHRARCPGTGLGLDLEALECEIPRTHRERVSHRSSV